MKLLSERNQVREVAERWKMQYGNTTQPEWKAKTAALEDLDKETATAADVAEIIGNDSWACPQQCDECGARSWNVVQLGEEPDYESRTANVCFDCLAKAHQLAESMAH